MDFVCIDCGKRYPAEEAGWRCGCGGALICDFEPSLTKEDIAARRISMWRYDRAYPLKYKDLDVTFNEGMTPLLPFPDDRYDLWMKMDSAMPTGSFKDRGVVMVVNFLKSQGVARVTEDSSGNAGASVAAYCALGGIPCTVYVPKGNSRGKITQARAYGAQIVEIEGSRGDVARAAQNDDAAYAGHNWHPMFLQGVKSLAYELWEQNAFMAPEHVVAPGGNGSILLGLYTGFRDLMKNGLIDRLPRLSVVQAENCNPIYRAYTGQGGGVFEKTIAEGIATEKPNRMPLILKALRETGGEAVCVSEREIAEALKSLGHRGFFVEPTSAVAYAGIETLYERRKISDGEQVVMVVSGHGLKAGAAIERML